MVSRKWANWNLAPGDFVAEADDQIERLEEEFPLCAGVAFQDARKRVLAAGQSVLQTEAGGIYEVFPDGRKVS